MSWKRAFGAGANSAELRAFLLVAVAAIILQLGSEWSNTWLILDREAVLGGQWWRLLTANLVHINFPHMWLNLAAFLAVLLVFPGANGVGRMLLYVAGCALAVSFGMQLFAPEILRYSGLSGVLHGIFVIKAYDEWHASKTLAIALICGLGVKIGYEQMTGGSASVARLIGGPVAVDAHLYGAIGGLLVVLTLLIAKSKAES